MNTSPWKSRFYEPLECIALGSFSVVYKARHKLDCNVYAIKRIDIIRNLQCSCFRGSFSSLKAEVVQQSKVNSDNVVKYVTSWDEGHNVESSNSENRLLEILDNYDSDSEFEAETEKDFLFIALEFCDLDMRQWLSDKPTTEARFNECDPRNVIRQLSLGLKAIHGIGIVHRDLKPENILLKSTGSGLNSFIWKIGDLGLCKIDDGNLCSPIGSRNYMAPELQHREVTHSQAADIYSLGLNFIELLISFSDKMEAFQTYQEIRRSGSPNTIIDQIFTNQDAGIFDFSFETKLIKSMLVSNPGERADIEEILQLLMDPDDQEPDMAIVTCQLLHVNCHDLTSLIILDFVVLEQMSQLFDRFPNVSVQLIHQCQNERTPYEKIKGLLRAWVSANVERDRTVGHVIEILLGNGDELSFTSLAEILRNRYKLTTLVVQ